MSKTGIIIQTRMGSTRLPGKIMLELAGKPVLWHVVERCKQANVDNVVVATTNKKEDDKIVQFCKENNYNYFRGSEEDVLDRYYQCAKEFGLDNIIRVTSDCPLIDYKVLNELVQLFKECDYCSNTINRTYPRGYDCAIFTFEALEYMWNNAENKAEREHVTKFILDNKDKFNIFELKNNEDYSAYRLTLDENDDYKLIKEIFSRLFEKDIFFGLDKVVSLMKKEPELAKINEHVEQKMV